MYRGIYAGPPPHVIAWIPIGKAGLTEDGVLEEEIILGRVYACRGDHPPLQRRQTRKLHIVNQFHPRRFAASVRASLPYLAPAPQGLTIGTLWCHPKRSTGRVKPEQVER